jgi:hypothetical protein
MTRLSKAATTFFRAVGVLVVLALVYVGCVLLNGGAKVRECDHAFKAWAENPDRGTPVVLGEDWCRDHLVKKYGL